MTRDIHTHTSKKNNLESRNKTRIQVGDCQHQHEETLEVLYRISPQSNLENSKCTVYIESAMKQTSCLYTDVRQTASEQTDLGIEEITHSRTEYTDIVIPRSEQRNIDINIPGSKPDMTSPRSNQTGAIVTLNIRKTKQNKRSKRRT
jgi:hypothetical protein